LTDSDKIESQVLPEGTKLVINAEEKALTITIDGKAPEPELQKVIDLFFDLSKANNSVSFKALFGTDEPKRAGDGWAGRMKPMVESLIKGGCKVEEPDLTGMAKLVGIEDCDGEKCLHLQLDATIKEFNPDWVGKIDKSMKLTRASGTMSNERWVPTDGSKPAAKTFTKATYECVYEGDSQGRHYVMEQTPSREFYSRLLHD